MVRSANGITWSTNILGSGFDFSGITFGKGTFVAVDRTGGIRTSTDAVNWTRQNSGTAQYLQAAAFGCGTFVVAAQDGTILSSQDATNWTSHPNAIMPFAEDLAYGNGSFVAVGGGGRIMQSGLLFPSLTIQFLATGSVQIGLHGQAGVTYDLQTTADFATWTSLTNLSPSLPLTYFTDPAPPVSNRKFYRAVQQ